VKHEAYHCSYEIKIRKESSVVLDIVPAFLTLTKYDGSRWWIRLWAEFSGDEANITEIEKVRKKITKLEVERSKRVKVDDSIKESDIKLTQHNLRLSDFLDQINFLSSTFFNLRELDTLLKYLDVEVKTDDS